ncbi:MAG TPA: hypothetical protein VGO40_24130 [Longimicrobium sp.]|jgi:hypothetical protein|nr:hypothetical protein [Longimicrobium sp.]
MPLLVPRPASAPSPDAADVDRLRAGLAPGSAPIIPLQLEATYGEGGFLQVQYALFVVNTPELQITSVTGYLMAANQQVIGYQSNAIGQLGNLGNTGGWGGQWALSGIDAYAGQTLTVAIVGQYSISGADLQDFGPFQTTVRIPQGT